jgi:endonuclease YncB( thermonuclease family)
MKNNLLNGKKSNDKKLRRNLKLATVKLVFTILTLIFLVNCTNSNNDKLENHKGNYYSISKVIDGDTYHIKSHGEKIKIRMEGIDAPEKGMPYYKESKEFLKRLCLGKKIKFIQSSKDHYGRIIAKTYLDDNRELGQEMIKNGMAWHFKKYSQDTLLARLETEAQNKHLGLWKDANPIAPWEFRKKAKKLVK